MKLTHTVYLLSGSYYGALGNVYAIKSRNKLILIDSGRSEHIDIIKDSLLYWELEKYPVTHVLLTHAHHDHAGCAKYFQERGAEIILNVNDSDMLKQGGYDQAIFPAEGFDFPGCVPDREIEGDGVLEVEF